VSIAAALIDWLATNPTKDPTLPGDRKVLIMGDLNSYAMEDPISAMTSTAFVKPPVVNAGDPNATYVNLVKSFRGDGAYSYVFEGQSGYLDHALANPVLNPLVIGIDEWHNNADEPVAIDYNVEWTASILKTPAQQASLYSANAYRASDHDPVLVGFNPLCGDLDDDGDVDTADQDLMRAQLGQPATAANRRMNFDGDDNIDVNDLRIFQGCFRAFTPGPGLE
jgi:predicted extracellular nuclease